MQVFTAEMSVVACAQTGAATANGPSPGISTGLKSAAASCGCRGCTIPLKGMEAHMETFGFHLTLPRGAVKKGFFLRREVAHLGLLCEICMAAAAAFTAGRWKKHSVSGWGSEGEEEEAKRDERKEKGIQHPQMGT